MGTPLPQIASVDLFRMEPGVQHYAWGDTRYIPEFLGLENQDREPYAELWMGAHPDLPSNVVTDVGTVSLDELIAMAPDAVLGSRIAAEFGGRLPFLLKVLSAARPLSIQVHPDARGARAGFARENAAGIPHSAPERNYKDEHHKPELLVALTDFWALRGFRPLEEIGRLTAEVPELAVLWSDLRPDLDSLRTGYVRCMTLAQDEVDSVLEPLIARLRHLDHENPFPPHGREYWVLRADREFSRVGHHDRGIFSLFLLNFVHLGPGEAIYLPAGILHAYLNGSALEIMASSNNVLRGGLTSKHVDVAELLANVRFEAGPAEILRGIPLGAGGEWIYRTTAREFELRRIELQAAVSHRGQAHPSAEILLVVEAQGHAPVHVSTSARRLSLRRGNSVFVPFGAGYSLSAEAKAVVYKAGIPWDGETGGEVLGKDTMGNKDRKDRKDRKENKDFEVE